MAPVNPMAIKQLQKTIRVVAGRSGTGVTITDIAAILTTAFILIRHNE